MRKYTKKHDLLKKRRNVHVTTFYHMIETRDIKSNLLRISMENYGTYKIFLLSNNVYFQVLKSFNSLIKSFKS